MLHFKIHQFYVKKELLGLLRVYRKSETSAQTDGRIATDGPLYTGQEQRSFKRRATQKKSASWKGKEIMYVGNFHENVAESDLVEPFGLRTANYLIDNCSIQMSNLQQNGKHNGHPFILAPCHVWDELVKLHGLEFHGRKIII